MNVPLSCRFLLLLALTACSGLTGPADSASVIAQFLAAENLPNVQTPAIRGRFRTYHGAVFLVAYGPEIPCSDFGPPKTCFAASALGLQVGARVGWLLFNLPHGATIGAHDYLDFKAREPDLYAARFWHEFSRVDEITYQQWFKERLIRDADVPLEVLQRIAGELSIWISPWLAGLLLADSRAGQDPTVLRSIAHLPTFQGDAYAAVRAQAALRLLACCGGR